MKTHEVVFQMAFPVFFLKKISFTYLSADGKKNSFILEFHLTKVQPTKSKFAFEKKHDS